MPQPTVLLVLGDNSKIHGTLTALPELAGMCSFINLVSLSNVTTYLDTRPGDNIPIVIVNYEAATEGMGGGSTTVSSKDRIGAIKSHLIAEGKPQRIVIGVTGLKPFQTQLLGLGCDITCDESTLHHHLIGLLKA